MNIRIVDCEKEFRALRSAWNSLTSEPMLSWEWNYAWWTHMGQEKQLQLFVAEESGEVCGIAPFMVERKAGQRNLRFLGSGATCSDYLKMLVAPQRHREFCEQVAEMIQSLPQGISLVELEGVLGEPDDFALFEQLQDAYWLYSRDLESSWVLELSDDWKSFVQKRHKSLRRKIRKAEKRFANSEVSVVSTNEDLDLDCALDLLVDLHQRRFQSKGLPGVFADADFERFLRQAVTELAKRQKAEVIVCFADESPVVAHLYLAGSCGPQMYQSGISNEHMKLEPGHLLFTHTVRRAIEQGHRQFDFLRGNEAYKALWGAEPKALYSLRCVSNGFLSTMTHQTMRGLRKVKRSLEQLGNPDE